MTTIDYIDTSKIKKKYKRNQENRQHETLNILLQLKKIEYPKHANAVKELIRICNIFVYTNNTNIKFIIPFPEIHKKIIGLLSNDIREKCVVLIRDIDNENNDI